MPKCQRGRGAHRTPLPMARAAAVLLLLCMASQAGAVHTAGREELPSPQTSPAACGRKVASFVCDPDHLLTRAGGDAVDHALAAIRRGARPEAARDSAAAVYTDAPACAGQSPGGARGYQVALALVRRAGGTGSAASRVERLARRVHNNWGVGDTCGSGVLVLIAVEDRQVYISTGASASKAAPDESLDLVIDLLRPLLRGGDYDAAALKAASSVGEVLAGRLSHRLPLLAWVAIGAVVVGFFLYCRWAEKRKRERYLAARRQLSALEQAAAAAKAARYAATSCPICMEDFAPERADGDGAAAGHDGASGSSSSGAGPSSVAPGDAPALGLKKELLRCGHAFCSPCLSRALAVKLACPICRQPPDRDVPPGAPPRQSSGGPSSSSAPSASCAAAAGDGAQAGGARAGGDVNFLPELVFRLRRVQLAFPEFVTPGMVDRWVVDAPAGGLEFTQDAAFVRADPSLSAPPRGSDGGGGGFGGGFGGGSTRGGGGRGGGW